MFKWLKKKFEPVIFVEATPIDPILVSEIERLEKLVAILRKDNEQLRKIIKMGESKI